MSTIGAARPARVSATLRQNARVTPLELFFDLVFVLALTQCTALMAQTPTWAGLAKGLLVLGILWWSWVGYAWLTSVVDPEEGAVRIVIFVAMAAFLVAALCVPEAFDELGLLFAGVYAVVRGAHIALFTLASTDDPGLRTSVRGLSVSTAIGVGLLTAASFTDREVQGGLWALAILLDAGGPLLFGAEGWKLVPGHFAERHGLIVLIALGESIVAIGIGAQAGVGTGEVVAACLGMMLAAGLWWTYFDVVALVAERRLAQTTEGRERNEMARDSYSFLHFPMVAGIVLIALGLKKTLEHVGDPLKLVPATALLGGVALYLLAHVAFHYRTVHTLNRPRLVGGVVALALIPLAVELPAVVTVGIVAFALAGLIAFETHSYGEARAGVRHSLDHEPAPPA